MNWLNLGCFNWIDWFPVVCWLINEMEWMSSIQFQLIQSTKPESIQSIKLAARLINAFAFLGLVLFNSFRLYFINFWFKTLNQNYEIKNKPEFINQAATNVINYRASFQFQFVQFPFWREKLNATKLKWNWMPGINE